VLIRSANRPSKQKVAGQVRDALVPADGTALATRTRRQGRWAGLPRYAHGYKTRVFTGAVCPVPHHTETVVSKEASP
jgi:hypothetical protein